MVRFRVLPLLLLFAIGWVEFAFSQSNENPFNPLTTELPPPDDFRLGSGAPGPAYWQQKVDYEISARLDDQYQMIIGQEKITYKNNSPHTLNYLWLQLDQNISRPGSINGQIKPAPDFSNDLDFSTFIDEHTAFKGGTVISAVRNAKGGGLNYKVIETNLRIDLPEPLLPGKDFQFMVDWDYPINDATLGGRCGYEFFERDKNYIYEVAQFYPRLCAYDPLRGWQNKPYLGPAEFALEFGDFKVSVMVPADHIVAATGTLMNPQQVLSESMQNRLKLAASHMDSVVQIITPDEAEQREGSRHDEIVTWVFEAKNVRDFAFASSRKFIWDAASVTIGEKSVMAHSLYPSEGLPLWKKYGIHGVIHALKSYSSYLIDYPYPQATAVHGPVWGMEYPMLAFCGGRPNTDGTYSRNDKYALISVILHEVGHNWFPMLLNNDERRWAWMDEGFNTFYHFLAEQSFEPDYPSKRGIPDKLAPFLKDLSNSAIMDNPETFQDATRMIYDKPTLGLNMLRETIMGREIFDGAMMEYVKRWAGKKPEPADFFRTMEDFSGIDLDWFWRSWFLGSDPVDFAVANVTQIKIDDQNPDMSRVKQIIQNQEGRKNLTLVRNKKEASAYYNFEKPQLNDFYSGNEIPEVTDLDRQIYETYLEILSPEEKNWLRFDKMLYLIRFENLGGCVLPLIFEVEFTDGTIQEHRLPAEIWNKNPAVFEKELITDKEIRAVKLDPHFELPDINRANDSFPQKIGEKTLRFYKAAEPTNPMQR